MPFNSLQSSTGATADGLSGDNDDDDGDNEPWSDHILPETMLCAKAFVSGTVTWHDDWPAESRLLQMKTRPQ